MIHTYYLDLATGLKKNFRWIFPKLNNFSFFRLIKLILSEEQLLSLDFFESLHPLIEIE